ncbi:MAG: hypothetical protein HY543_00810 [Deltaproteobacteria bacterium]|nr:hypothetical protein [Deltaproteobacteria bacterium]
MILLSNGHRFEYMAASGALAFDGRGWPWERPLCWLSLLDPRQFTIVIKTLTRHPRRGNLRWHNPLGCVRLLRGGTVNAIGLTNPGIDWWCERVGPRIGASGLHLAGSITSDALPELAEMAAMLNPFPLVAVELNASCPNSQAEMMANTRLVIDAVRAAKSAMRHPLILKLSVVHDYVTIAKAVADLVEAVAINSVPWRHIFGDRPSPLAHLGGGGVSGKAAQVHTWKMVQELATHTSVPVIGPSVWEYADIARLRNLGAQAISFGAIFLRYPWRPTRYVRRDQSGPQSV